MKHENERIYTREECVAMIDKMRRVSSAFYWSAANTGCHAFIEFNGLMNEFIQICERAVDQDLDFNTCNTHTGQSLPVNPHNIEYLAEKLNCIYGPALASNPALAKMFCERVTEQRVTIHDESEEDAPGRTSGEDAGGA